MPKFFVLPDNIKNDKIRIDADDAAHISRVLRMGVGEEITVCDSIGMDYKAVIEIVESKEIWCRVVSKQESDSEPQVKVTLYQGIPKGAKMEYIIQKTTELGITDIVPCNMSRCVSKIEGKQEKKIERWQKIAEAAAKQSGRGIVPRIHNVMNFEQAVAEMRRADLCFAPYECEEQKKLRSILRIGHSIKTAAFMIGPEGGFDPGEIENLKNENIPTVTLGKRILRTETAGEAVLAMMMYEWEEI